MRRVLDFMKKTIAVILPVNNKDMLRQEDLAPYQTTDYFFKLSYAETPLKELNTASDDAMVLPLVLQKIQEAEATGASAAIVFAFGDVGIQEGRELVTIPVIGLGKSAAHMASLLCRHRFTILPAMLNNNTFIENLIVNENLQQKFVLASHSIEYYPQELRSKSDVLEKLIDIALLEYQEKSVDTFTLGCGCFMGIAKKLEITLKEKLQKPIIVVDPVEVPFKLIQAL